MACRCLPPDHDCDYVGTGLYDSIKYPIVGMSMVDDLPGRLGAFALNVRNGPDLSNFSGGYWLGACL